MGAWDDILKGTKGDDIIYGGAGDDYLQGRAGDDILDGGDGNDQIHGDADDDYLVGGRGNDLIHGGIGGFDTAVYFGSIFEYSHYWDGDNFVISHLGGSGIDGTDRLMHVERLIFADAVIDLTQNNAPIAFDDAAATDEDVGTYSSGSSSVLDNDFDWEGQALTVAAGSFSGTYGTLVMNSDGTYTYTPFASNQGLDDGETVQDSFSYTVSDGSLTDTGTLTITIAGVNDAPIANDDTASTSEDAAVSGNVLANDTDVDGEALTVANAGAYVGAYGTLTLAADGSYTYTPNAAAQALDDGETAQDVFSYTASDGTASDTATLTVTVTGVNDAPVANDDTASTSEDAGVSGNVLANDTDVDGEALTVANPGTYVGAYGTLTLAADGSYTYTPSAAAQGLDDGEVVSDAFSYTASDGTASASATLTVNVAGANDAPVANDDTASTGEDAGVSGNVLANDTDVDGEALTVTNPGTYAGTYGSLTLSADGSYTYTPNAAANGLAVGETAQDVFSYTASDGTASGGAALTVTVTGANDAPTIDAGGTDANGSVTELPNDDPGENSATHSDSGTIAFDDVDLSDTHSATATAQGGGYLGSFTLDPVDQTGDSVGWSFSVSDADLDSLEDGEVVTQTYTVQIDDGNGGTVSQDVTVTITGAADGPPSWYIDNSAVGSANLGTQADPFTSIAAFNAAQGTPGGPDVGQTVYLLAGTGVYAEASGITLLDGQTLTGVAAGPLRPTISPSAGPAVDLAEDNVLSGFDVVTGGDGIVDDSLASGSLSISDVSVTTTGGVAIGIAGATGVSIANVSIVSTGSYAILAADVNGFALTDSVIVGSASADAALAFTELSGSVDLLGNLVSGAGGDNLRIVNTGGSLDLEIADGANQAVFGHNDLFAGDDGVEISTSGTASLTLSIDGVDFTGAASDLLHVSASGSSTQDIEIRDSVFHNSHGNIAAAGGGVILSGSGTGVTVNYLVEGSSFQGANGTALSASYGGGTIRGRVEGNVIGNDDGLEGTEGSSGGGSGIFIDLEKSSAGTATYSVAIVDNEIRDVGLAGMFISVSDSVGGSSAVLEALVSGNTIEEMTDFSFAALYAVVGGAGPGDSSELGLDLHNNVIDNSGADFGANAVVLDQVSENAHYNLPGYTGSADGEFTANPGMASVDIDAFLTGQGNVMTNGAFAFQPGGVDASFVTGVTGDPFVLPVWVA